LDEFNEEATQNYIQEIIKSQSWKTLLENLTTIDITRLKEEVTMEKAALNCNSNDLTENIFQSP
jgi:hypothetical protein